MTDVHQPEYIITDMQVKRIMVLMNRDTCMDEDEFLDIAKELRTRPHTPATELYNVILKSANELERDKELIDAYKRGEEAGARAATLKTLDILERDFKGRYVEDAIAHIRRFPESLRQQAGEQQ
jgi:hypothetical protein